MTAPHPFRTEADVWVAVPDKGPEVYMVQSLAHDMSLDPLLGF